MNPIARMELALEPGTSVTISLVLPLVDACMYALSEGTGVTVDGEFRPYDELHEATKRARSRVLDGLTHAFSTGIDQDFLTTLQMATFCDPRHKHFEHKCKSAAAIRKFKKESIAKAKVFYDMHYKPKLMLEGEAEEAEEEEDEEEFSPP